MPKRILDTNILIAHFKGLKPLAERGPSDAEDWARVLIQDKGTNAIVSPVEIEILVGVQDPHELELTEAFLRPFAIIDERRVLPEDWEEARRIAKRVVRYDREVPRRHRRRPRERNPKTESRDFGDCLITAIASRLNCEVITDDQGLHRQAGRASQG